MEAGGHDVGEQRQVLDFRHGAGFVGQAEQVEIGVRHHDVLGLSAHPAAHVNVSISSPGPGRVDVQTDARLALFAIAAAPTGDVERNRNQVTDFDELHVAAGLDHFAGNLVPQNQTFRGGSATAHHVLVAAANVCANDLENDAVLAFARP